MLIKSSSEPHSNKAEDVLYSSPMTKDEKNVKPSSESRVKRDYDKDRQDMLYKIKERKRLLGVKDNSMKNRLKAEEQKSVAKERPQKKIVKRNYEKEREEMRKMIAERKKAVLEARVPAKPLLSTDDTGISLSSEMTTVVNALPDRCHTADSGTQRERPGSAVSSNARTAQFVTTLPENHRIESPSSTSSQKTYAHVNDAPIVAVLGNDDSNYPPAPQRSSWSTAAEYFGKFASLLFRRDQKIKPMSPKLKAFIKQLETEDSHFDPDEVKEEFETPVFNDSHENDDEDAFGSEDEDWRNEILDESNDGEQGVEEPIDDAVEILCENANDSEDPSTLLDYTLMLEDMQAILRLPSETNADSDGNTVFDDGFEDVSVATTSKDDELSTEFTKLPESEEIEEVVDFRGDPSPDVHINNTVQFLKDVEGTRLNLNAFIEESNKSDDRDATRLSQIHRLQNYLTKKLGEKKFLSAYQFLKDGNALKIEEEALLAELERILSIEGLLYLDEIFTLLALESQK